MTVTTIDALTGPFEIIGVHRLMSRSWNYSIARNGGETMFEQTGPYEVFQWYFSSQGNYFVTESYLAFDTSIIPDDDDITSIELQMYATSGTPGPGGWDIEVREVPWGPTASAADWVQGGSLGSYPLVASTPTFSGAIAWMSFTSDPAFLSVAGLKTGIIYLHLSSSRTRSGNAPSTGGTEERANWDDVAPFQPKLVITHEAAAAPVEEVTAALVLDLTLAGELDEIAVVEEITTSLGVNVSLEGELGDVGPVEEITATLVLTVSLDGELLQVPEVVAPLTTSLPVTIEMGGTLITPPLGVPRLRAGVHLTVSGSGTLASVTENVQSLQTALTLHLSFRPQLGHPPVYRPVRPQGRAVTKPYVRTSISRVYKSRSQSRRF